MMLNLIRFLIVLVGYASTAACGTSSVVEQLRSELSSFLSSDDLISTVAPPRWSSFAAPVPAAVVNVATEEDVAKTVKYCADKGFPFLAQNGGEGWATTFHLGKNGILINLAHLNQVTFSANRTQATIGGGSNISNTISKAYAAGALLETGNCNCVGTLGAILGGGYGNLIGLYGFGVDNVLSVRLVTPGGRIRQVDARSDPELFWALLGAGPNFGIVTSAVVRSHPATDAQFQAWTGGLIFSPDKLEEVVQAIQDLELKPHMNVFMYFAAAQSGPAILVTPFLYMGNASSARAAFASLYDVGPEVDTTAVVPYDQWNAGADGFCTRGGRKPSYSVGLQKMIPGTWRQVWDKYVEFQQRPGAENSVVLVEAYSLIKARSKDPNSTSFPHRNVNFNAVAIPWYNDISLDDEAQAFGSAARELWRATDGLAQDSTYINFAHGDEPLEVIYGDSLPKLRAIKRHVDPKDRFNHWFNLG